MVGVVALPLVQSEGSLGQSLKRVLRLGSLGRFLLSGLGGGLLLGGSLLLWLFSLLRGHVGELGGVEELELGRNGRVDGLVVDSLVPSRDVRVLLTPLLVEEEFKTTGDNRGGEQVSEGNTLANEVGVVLQVLLNGSNGLCGQLGSIIDVLLVVGVTADQGTVPLAESGQNLGL